MTAPVQSPRLIRYGWVLWAASMLLTAGGLILFAINRPHLGTLEYPGYFSGVFTALVYASIGMLIIHCEPRLPFGCLFMALAIPFAIANLFMMIAVFGLIVNTESIPAIARFSAWLQNWVQCLTYPTPIAMLLILYPNGRLPGPKWRWAIAFSIMTTLMLVAHAILEPGRIYIYITAPEISLRMVTPTGIQLSGFWREVLPFSWALSILTIPIGAYAVLVRFRSADWAERQQLKWLVYLLAVLILIFVITLLGGGSEIINDAATILFIALLPTGTAWSILRYNLYGIDLIIRRTIQYTLLTGTLAAVYFGLVLTLQPLFSNLSDQQSPSSWSYPPWRSRRFSTRSACASWLSSAADFSAADMTPKRSSAGSPRPSGPKWTWTNSAQPWSGRSRVPCSPKRSFCG